jgi:hypothetical protein
MKIKTGQISESDMSAAFLAYLKGVHRKEKFNTFFKRKKR